MKLSVVVALWCSFSCVFLPQLYVKSIPSKGASGGSSHYNLVKYIQDKKNLQIYIFFLRNILLPIMLPQLFHWKT